MEDDLPPPFKPAVPGLVYCGCGRRMRVQVIWSRKPLLSREEQRQAIASAGGDGGKLREVWAQAGWFECWLLHYTCLTCLTHHSDREAQYGEEEARRLAAQRNAEAGFGEA